jgi:hypothetical protein
MTTHNPGTPIFFCAPAYISPNFAISMGRDKMVEDMSATRGTEPVSGTYGNSTPPIVSFGV